MKYLVILTSLVACCFAIQLSHDLSLHSENLVRMFSDYLLKNDQLLREGRDVEVNRINRQSRVMRKALSLSYKVQNFAIWYEPGSGMRFCETNQTVIFKQCLDTSSNCKYLDSTLQICKKPDAAKNLGCLQTCQLCNDKCATGDHSCLPLADCNPEGNTFRCTCKKGYQGDGVISCTDIDECATKKDNCFSNQICENKAGGYRCISRVLKKPLPSIDCVDGYTFKNGKCKNVNECLNPKLNACHKDAECSDTDGSYTCRCKQGFTGSGSLCIDIDECKIKKKCSPHVCINTPGSYLCQCRSGFRGNGLSCKDIDECLKGERNSCHKSAKCTNTFGSYSCKCQKGFEGNGFQCKDIDECRRRSTNNCHHRAKCTNVIGTFSCACRSGYEGDGVRKCGRKRKYLTEHYVTNVELNAMPIRKKLTYIKEKHEKKNKVIK
ncbi:fibulin-1-like isoform X2 [Ostrea edulis]|uniref:fibulin-1-like isoform X2 n=1 Tax=Ostrea edulis TaxID=37623 RepID=UPI0024AF8399|nr:fibulin-1-like isoform X2 [Ostrea edulis]